MPTPDKPQPPADAMPTWAGIEEPPGRAEALAVIRAPRRRWTVQTPREETVIMVIDKPGIVAGLPYQYINQQKTRK